MRNDFQYKWSKIFASKRYHTKDGIIKLTPEEQQEILDDVIKLNKPKVEKEVCYEHEWKSDKFDCYGNPLNRYCDNCGLEIEW